MELLRRAGFLFLLTFAISVNAQNAKPVFQESSPITRTGYPGMQTVLQLSTYDSDPNDTVRIYLVSSDINGQFNSNNDLVKHASSEFVVNPINSDASIIPYELNFIAVDNALIPDTVYLTAYITIHGLPAIHALSSKELDCGFWTFSIDVNSWTSSNAYSIRDSDAKVVANGIGYSDTLLLKPGKYRSEYTLSNPVPNNRIYFDSFEIIGGAIPKILGPQKVCIHSVANFEAEFISQESVLNTSWVLTYNQQLEIVDTNTDKINLTIKGDAILSYQVRTDKCLYESSKSIKADPCLLGMNKLDDAILNVYPNPSNREIQIEAKEEGYLQIISRLGQEVLSFQLNQGLVVYDISTLSQGSYTLVFRGESGNIYRTKIIKY